MEPQSWLFWWLPTLKAFTAAIACIGVWNRCTKSQLEQSPKQSQPSQHQKSYANWTNHNRQSRQANFAARLKLVFIRTLRILKKLSAWSTLDALEIRMKKLSIACERINIVEISWSIFWIFRVFGTSSEIHCFSPFWIFETVPIFPNEPIFM